ncbi:MaoC/PaaZ C-terminal domain-containing protein [Alphaproteobacteria bacterium]|jgi:acyl dehydratase|nr:MaoC/PaaZ C-terminal domain-containing protein [Alphaproteobacteria bacterium]MDB9915423.1 MaoC/PaaZ C-terminal domain-containing protein [Alphaproteobacteria bacterium]|tara:strand:- start:1150 stop:1602 length:453 start_codon:yes stop_codon:yes gene_type:complete
MKRKPMYFEDFTVGLTFTTDETLISKNEIIDFASKYDPQTFHLDEELAKDGPFGQLTSSGFMTLGKSFTQIFNTEVFNGTSMGAWGLDELRWTKPVYPNDILKTKVEVLETKKSKKNPTKGTVRLKQTVTNQNDEIVMTWISNSMLKTKE